VVIRFFNAETQSLSERQMRDPGVEVRRGISFKSTNLIGSFQDDGKSLKSKTTDVRTTCVAPGAAVNRSSTEAKQAIGPPEGGPHEYGAKPVLKSAAVAASHVKKFLPIIALSLLVAPFVSGATVSSKRTIIFDGKATEVSTPSAAMPANDLWITAAELTRATGFEVKPQGVCRKELCFPLPSARKSEFLVKHGNVQWFNLSAFARLLRQPIAFDKALATWYFGPRPEVQNNYLASFQAPNFTLPDTEGKTHSLSDFRGKKVLIVTWASW
jgi:AhpC/TSA family protein